jgi:isoleucyl-tRNA synthetase
MRWMFSKQKPEDNILFGYGTADDARRELLVLWNVYAFFVTYARLANWTPSRGVGAAEAASWSALDRWILSRAAGVATQAGTELADFDAMAACRAISTFIDDLSTWYLRRSRDRMRVRASATEREPAFATLHAALVTAVRTMAPILPFLSESMYQNLVVSTVPDLPDSVHLTAWPADVMAEHRNEPLEQAMATLRRAVDLARTLRSQAGLRTRQPLRQLWLAIPGGRDLDDELIELLADETNVKHVHLIGDESELVERRIRPLLPKIGKRLGGKTQDVLAAARSNDVEYLGDDRVRLAGVELTADEVEIIATPRAGTAVAHENGLVVVIDTEIDDELRAEGDARELTRAVQDLRKQVGLQLDDLIDLWVVGPEDLLGPLRPFLDDLAHDTLAVAVHHSDAPADGPSASQDISGGSVTLALRQSGASA